MDQQKLMIVKYSSIKKLYLPQRNLREERSYSAITSHSSHYPHLRWLRKNGYLLRIDQLNFHVELIFATGNHEAIARYGLDDLYFLENEQDAIECDANHPIIERFSEVEIRTKIAKYGKNLPKLYLQDLFCTTDPKQDIFTSGAVRNILKPRYDLLCPALETAIALAADEGAEKYAADNWTLGLPVSSLINHTIAHLNAYRRGDRSEDHVGHAAINLMFLKHFESGCTCHKTRAAWKETDASWQNESTQISSKKE